MKENFKKRKEKKTEKKTERNKQNGKSETEESSVLKAKKESTLMTELSNETKINAIEETIFRMLAQRTLLVLSPGNQS